MTCPRANSHCKIKGVVAAGAHGFLCVNKGCSSNKDCPVGLQCANTRKCSFSDDCPAGMTCPSANSHCKMKVAAAGYKCVVKKCSSNKDCPADMQCPNAIKCSFSEDCPAGMKCP